MPCDTVQTATVQAELQNINYKLLKKALEAMGFTVNEKDGFLTFYGIHKGTSQHYTGTYQNGKFEQKVRGFYKPLDINAVKQAYSHQVVQQTAKSFGWKLKKTSANTYTAQKG